jgi:hypothetical protein
MADQNAGGSPGTPGANSPAPIGGPPVAAGVTGPSTKTPGPQMNGSAPQQTAPPGAAPSGVPGTNPGNSAASGDKDAAPHFAPPLTNPPPKKPPPPLRIARLNGDRDYLIFIECRPDDVVLYPSRQMFTVQQLARGDQTLLQAVQKMIERRQSLVRPGELPFRPQVRFLVHPESIRSYHTAYPLLATLDVPQTRQNLDAEDDVTAIVTGQ